MTFTEKHRSQARIQAYTALRKKYPGVYRRFFDDAKKKILDTLEAVEQTPPTQPRQARRGKQAKEAKS
jgi:hypothetical protein